jgi:hypothetical protein
MAVTVHASTIESNEDLRREDFLLVMARFLALFARRAMTELGIAGR